MERGAAPAGVARNHALGRLRASCRAALRPLCEVLAGRAGANAGSRKPGPELRRRRLRQKCRGGAPRGAPASVIGRWSLADQGSARPRGGPRVRRSAPAPVGALPPLISGRNKGTTAYPAPQRIRVAERWLSTREPSNPRDPAPGPCGAACGCHIYGFRMSAWRVRWCVARPNQARSRLQTRRKSPRSRRHPAQDQGVLR
jgi:hypothetical protein